jgi:hypothetical protein
MGRQADLGAMPMCCPLEFHQPCIEPWLVQHQRYCPLCKQDPVATERSRLLPAAHVQEDTSAAVPPFSYGAVERSRTATA